MSSLHHRLSRDELIVLVETIESHLENKYRMVQAKCKVMEELLNESHHSVRTCYSCGKFEIDRLYGLYWFSDNQKWIRMNNINTPAETIKQYGDMLIYQCDCACGCQLRMCKQCCCVFNGDQNYTICNHCKDCPNIDPEPTDNL